MPAQETTSIGPRLTLNRAQRALAFTLLLLLITLLIMSFRASAAQREHAAMRARTEVASHNAFYTVRDTLSYTNEAERYLLGDTSRRSVQVARALLGQRLQVVGPDGVTAGDAATPAYRSALGAMDDAMRQVPAGTLPPDERARWTDVVLPKANSLDEATRALSLNAAVGPSDGHSATEEDLMRTG